MRTATFLLAAAMVMLPVAPLSAQTVPSPNSRTEILTFDSWTVTCRDGREPKDKRSCSAELPIVQEANGQRRVLFSWLLGLTRDGAPTSVFRFVPGVSIAPGVEFKLPDKPPRKIAITACEPTYCDASAPLDDGLIRDASAANQAEAVITASDGRQVTFTLNTKGFTQALAAIRK